MLFKKIENQIIIKIKLPKEQLTKKINICHLNKNYHTKFIIRDKKLDI